MFAIAQFWYEDEDECERFDKRTDIMLDSKKVAHFCGLDCGEGILRPYRIINTWSKYGYLVLRDKAITITGNIYDDKHAAIGKAYDVLHTCKK